MAELLGKVVKRSNQTRSYALPSTDTWQPHLGMHDFDREWLGSAKDLIMPSAGGGLGGAGGGGDGGGQMVDLNLDILNKPSSSGKEGASSSATRGDLEGNSSWDADRERSRLESVHVHDAERKDSGTSGVNV